MEELLDAVEEEQDQEEACQFVKDLLDFVEKLPAEGTSKSNAGELRQLEELKKQYLQIQKAQAEVKEAIEKEIKTLSEKLVQVNTNMAQHDTRAKQEQQAQIEPDEHMGPATPLEEKGKKKRTYERGAESDTREMVQELRTEMAELRKMLVTSLENSYKPPQWRPTGTQQRTRPKGCRACIANGAGESCRHCYRCGQSGHLTRRCQSPREPQGNGEGLLLRDPQ
ncbi:UNVERIFIED_CONTAM: hypothetical protein FKN15_015028 [Acipenser sinensis]